MGRYSRFAIGDYVLITDPNPAWGGTEGEVVMIDEWVRIRITDCPTENIYGVGKVIGWGAENLKVIDSVFPEKLDGYEVD